MHAAKNNSTVIFNSNILFLLCNILTTKALNLLYWKSSIYNLIAVNEISVAMIQL